jgi:hypothetical protein
MSNLELFLLGLGVTLLTALALAPLIWAAIQDGRYNDEQQQLYREQALGTVSTPASAEPSGVSHAS